MDLPRKIAYEPLISLYMYTLFDIYVGVRTSMHFCKGMTMMMIIIVMIQDTYLTSIFQCQLRNPRVQEMLEMGNQFNTMSNQAAIGINMIVAVAATFMIAYYCARLLDC